MAKKGSQLTVRTATEIQGGEFVILGYAGKSYQMTLDELKKFIGIIEDSGGSVDLTQVSTDILPLADVSKDIGSLEKRWKKVYSTALTVKAQSVDEEEVNIHDGGIEGKIGQDIQWSIDGSGKANFYELTVNGADVATMDYVNNELSKYVTTDELTKNYVSNSSLTEILKKYYESGYVDFLLSSKASTGDLNKTNAQLGIVRADVDTLKSYFQDTDDVDDIINKWRELEAFLAGQTETSTLADLLSVKADKDTVTAINSRVTDLETADFVDIDSLRSTLGGYYTKEEVDGLLGEAGGVDLTGYVNEIAASGTGNGIASVSKDGSKLTFTKANFLTDATVPAARTTFYGGIKIGYKDNGKNYGVLLDDSGKAYVNVPWESYDLSKFLEITGGSVNYLQVSPANASDSETINIGVTANEISGTHGNGTVDWKINSDGAWIGANQLATQSWVDDKGYLTASSSLSSAKLDKKTINIVSTPVTLGESITKNQLITNLGLKGLAFKDSIDLSGYQPLITSTNKLAYSLISGTPTLAAVATSGSYNDLTNKPTIPSAITESTVSGWGFVTADDVATELENFLPLDGGTIKSTKEQALTLYRNASAGGIGIKFECEKQNGWVGYIPSSYGVYLYTNNHYLYLTKNGVAKLDANTLIHSGNIASQSVQSAYTAQNASIADKATNDSEGNKIVDTYLKIENYNTDTVNLATKDYVNTQGFLKDGNIRNLVIKNSGGTELIAYRPTSSGAELTLQASHVGLGNVENTKLSTWAGSANITTLGTITSGTWNGTKIANAYLANNSIAIAGTSIALGGSMTQNQLISLAGVAAVDAKFANYLPLAGGTLTGILSIDNSRTDIYFCVRQSEISKACFGWQSGVGAYLYNYSSYRYLGISDEGTPFYKTSSGINTLIHSGNYSSYALPLSGGTISGELRLKQYLRINAWEGYGTGSCDAWYNGNNGSLCMTASDIRLGSDYSKTVIHSGNISSHAVTPSNLESTLSDYPLANGTRATGTWGINISGSAAKLGGFSSDTYMRHYRDNEIDLNLLSTTDPVVVETYKASNTPSSLYNWWQVMNWGSEDSAYGVQLANSFYSAANGTLYIRSKNNGTWNNWKQLAFTDSTVAAAKSLVNNNGNYVIYNNSHAFYVGDNLYTTLQTYILGKSVTLRYGESATHGLILNSSGNVTIGNSDLAGTSCKLYVNGDLNIASNRILGNGNTDILNSQGDWVILGYGNCNKKWPTYIDGNNIYFRYGTDHTVGMCINYLGNVGIGTTSPNTKLHVVGGTKIEGALSTYGITATTTAATDAAFTHYVGSTKLWWVSSYNNCANFNTALYVQSGSSPIKVATVNDLSSYLPKTGGTIGGSLTFSSTSGSHIIGNANNVLQLLPGTGSAPVLPIKIAKLSSGRHTIYCDEDQAYDLGTSSYGYYYVYSRYSSASSDATKKNIIGNIPLTTAQIANAPAVSFTWKDSGEKSHGTIAQYWKEILPEFVSGDEGSYGLNYAALGVVSSIILARNIETHEQRIARLEKEISDLQKKLNALVNNE